MPETARAVILRAFVIRCAYIRGVNTEQGASPPDRPDPKPKKQYFNSIDGLRLIASVNVVLFHMEAMGGLNDLHGSPGWLFLLIKGPAFHATLFFILAGFIFTIKYAPQAATFSTLALTRARFRDLYPLHALTVLAMLPFPILAAWNSGALPLGKLGLSGAIHLSLLWSIVPLDAFSLNTPSWALSAFFLCYLLFGPALRAITPVTSRRAIVACMAGCMIVPLGWGFLYASVGQGAYTFFHIFAPVRFFEFILGMLLARLYVLNTTKPRTVRVRSIPYANDLLILACLALLAGNLAIRKGNGPLIHWLSYHVFMLPIYATMLYRLARGNGLVARLFAFKAIRQLGKCSFYPYLLHIPLISWTAWIAREAFGFDRILHHPWFVLIFMLCLYGGSYLYWLKAPKRKRTTYRPTTGAAAAAKPAPRVTAPS